MNKSFPIKKIIVFLAVLCSLEMNQTKADVTTDKKLHKLERAKKMKEKNKALLVEFMDEIWNKGNLDMADKFVAFPYVIRHDPGDPWDGQSLDLETFKKRVGYSRQIFPDLHFSIQDVVAEEDKVIISWYLEGTHRGDIPGFPPTGKRVSVSGLTIYDFADGKITGHWQVVDRLGFMQQIGSKSEGK
jgi:steroid delta-isomerase-like uncharacterized protein